MITETYRNSDYNNINNNQNQKTFFIVGESYQQIMNELKQFKEKYKTESNEIWVYATCCTKQN